MSDETVLILGGTGVIGSHLARCLAERNYAVTVLSRSSRFAVPDVVATESGSGLPKIELVPGDINDRELLCELVQRADIVMQKTAATGVAGAAEDARDYTQSNIGATANLVDVLSTVKHKVRQVILGSSISVYGEGSYDCKSCGSVRPALRYKPSEQDSDQNSEQSSAFDPRCPRCASPVVPCATDENAERLGESVYSVSKKAQEDLLLGCCHKLGIDLMTLRYSTVIGPFQSWHNQYTRFLEALFQGTAPVLHEDGLQTRDLIGIDDIVRANLLCIERAAPHTRSLASEPYVSAFNIGRGEAVTLSECARLLSEAVAKVTGGKLIEPVIDGRFVKGDVRHCHLDCSKAERELGFVAQVPLRQSIDDLVEWFARRKGVSIRSS